MLILGLNLMDNELRAYRREQRTVVPDAATGQTRYQSLLVHDVEGRPYTLEGETQQPALATASQPYAENAGLETCAVCHGPGREFDVTEVHR